MNTTEDFFSNYTRFKSPLSGRFLPANKLEPLLENLGSTFRIEEIGRSFLSYPIKTVEVGTGPIRILAWSQMHGNETTTTKGIMDLLNYLKLYNKESEVQKILQKITLLVIPMLNPDGAGRYTRESANEVDLNRDARETKEPESKVLRQCFEKFEPHFCFNLHDQRTIFGAGREAKPATLSFLAPSMDEARSLSPSRIRSMKVIVAINMALQEIIPKQVGRFDDGFNINCTGDYFQSQEVPTILFECGHFPQDYLREKTRELFTFSIYTALKAIASGSYLQQEESKYFDIPENEKCFYDIILRNAMVAGETVDVAIQFSEKLKSGVIEFIPVVQTIAPELRFFGHREIECEGGEISGGTGERLSENDIVEVILLNKKKLLIKSPSIS